MFYVWEDLVWCEMTSFLSLFVIQKNAGKEGQVSLKSTSSASSSSTARDAGSGSSAFLAFWTLTGHRDTWCQPWLSTWLSQGTVTRGARRDWARAGVVCHDICHTIVILCYADNKHGVNITEAPYKNIKNQCKSENDFSPNYPSLVFLKQYLFIIVWTWFPVFPRVPGSRSHHVTHLHSAGVAGMAGGARGPGSRTGRELEHNSGIPSHTTHTGLQGVMCCDGRQGARNMRANTVVSRCTKVWKWIRFEIF